MRLTTVFLIASLMQVSAASFGQLISINQKNVPLRSVLKEIRKQSGYDFYADSQTVPNNQTINIAIKNATVEQALKSALTGLPLDYEINGNRITIKKKEEPSFMDNIIARFQAIDVRGKVVDSLGVGIAGATVSIKNGKGSISTAANGDFYLKNVEEGAVLVISFMGYVTKEQAASKDFNYIVLKQSTSHLDEVVVQAYGTTTRRLNTGNIAVITAKEIENQPVNNPLLALAGRVPGLTITPSSGLPGAPVKVQIRGQNSLSSLRDGKSTTDPLYVIDGIPYYNLISGLGGGDAPEGTTEGFSAFSLISPSEIESISILKDADATSVYGSRGSNGVILITTKKGKSGSTSFDVGVKRGIQNLVRKLDLMKTPQYIEMRREAFKNDGLTSMLDPLLYGQNFPELLIWDQNKNTDWQEVLLGGTGHFNDLFANVSGGHQQTNYRLSGNYHDESSVFPGSTLDQKGSINLNVGMQSPNQKFRAEVRVGYTVNKNSGTPLDLTRAAVTLPPNAPALLNTSGELNWETNPYTGNTSTFASNPDRSQYIPREVKYNGLTTSADITYSPISDLNLKATVGYNLVDGNSFTVLSNAASSPPEGLPYLLRMATFRDSKNSNISVEPQASYARNLGKGKLKVLLGGSYQSRFDESKGMDAYGFSSDYLMESLGQATSFSNIQNTSSQFKYLAVFARLTYDWKEKYLLNMSARRDGSSRFGPGRQFGNFGSVGIGWVFSEEEVIKKLDPVLSFGKVRFSYGSSGNDNIGDYRYLELYTPRADTYHGVKPQASSGLFNPDYGWELVKKMEVGLDLGFFNDKLLLNLAYFRNRSSNLLGGYLVPATAGPGGGLTINQPAKIQNMGWEFVISNRSKIFKAVTINNSLNFSKLRNKMLANLTSQTAPQGFVDPAVGQPFFGTTEVRLFAGVDPVTGQYQFYDENGEKTFRGGASKRIFIDPKFSGGLTSNFSYKGFSLNAFFQVTKQIGQRYDMLYEIPPGGSADNQPSAALNRWQKSGDIARIQRYALGYVNPVPDVTIPEAYQYLRTSDAAYVDASFIKLKSLALTFSLPTNLVDKMHLKNLSFFAEGQNLFTITNYEGLDPEVRSPFSLPPIRTMVFGINLNL